MSRSAVAMSYALVLVLALELALWGSFLVSARPLGHALPVAAAVAIVGNLALGLVGGRLLRRQVGAVVPGLVWLAVAITLGTRTAEGDVVVTNTWPGLTFLVSGAAAAAVAVGLSGVRKNGATP